MEFAEGLQQGQHPACPHQGVVMIWQQNPCSDPVRVRLQYFQQISAKLIHPRHAQTDVRQVFLAGGRDVVGLIAAVHMLQAVARMTELISLR